MKRSLTELDEDVLKELKAMKTELGLIRVSDIVKHLLEFHKTHLSKVNQILQKPDTTKTHKTIKHRKAIKTMLATETPKDMVFKDYETPKEQMNLNVVVETETPKSMVGFDDTDWERIGEERKRFLKKHG